MNWASCDSISGISGVEKNPETNSFGSSQTIHIQNEQNNLYQLRKYQDPGKNVQRNTYMSIASRLGDLIANSIQEADLEGLLTDDFEIFLFNFGEICPVQYANNRNEFMTLYKETRVIRREVKEVNVDLDRATVFHICYCEIRDTKENKIIPQFSCEIFSFKDNKICKYRASFGCPGSFSEHQHPFIPSNKDLMLAKVKEFNYAWADQPDLEKVASLFHESTEYKIWRWKDQKPFTFSQSDFAAKFRNLEENYALKSVVPYEVYSEGQFIMSHYVFHLEGKHEQIGKKFMWLSTCIYKFDDDLNITKITQHGEFHPEDGVAIPFISVSREDIKERTLNPKRSKVRVDLGALDTRDMNFSFEASRFGPNNFWTIDSFRGFIEYDKLSKVMKDETRKFEWEKFLDFYVDFNDPSYSVAVTIGCLKGIINKEDFKYSGIDMNFYLVRKVYIENGKLAKITTFHSIIPEPIPSPFDDKTFTTQNIICKE